MSENGEEAVYPSVFSLTHLTGRTRGDERRTVILTVETKQSTAWVLAIATVVSLPVTALFYTVLGAFAFLVPVIFDIVVLTLWEARQQRGMKLRAYQAILDKRRAGNDQIYIAGEPLRKPVMVMHQPVLLPGTPSDSAAIARAPEPVVVRGKKRRRGKKRMSAKELLQ